MKAIFSNYGIHLTENHRYFKVLANKIFNIGTCYAYTPC